MAPNQRHSVDANSSANDEILVRQEETLTKLVAPQAEPRKFEIVWLNVIVFSYYHIAAIYGLYLGFTSSKWATVAFAVLTYFLSALGTTAGVHRLWAHKTYKAKKSLQIFLMICHSLANQHSILHWARDHRLHHKYSDTDADPHNATRGFFYSHIGWLLVKKHPEVKKRGRQIDLSDIYSNNVVMFQRRHEYWFIMFVAFVIPTVIPVYLWKETWSAAYHINMLRYILGLNATFLVNSAAHMWGYRPYDKHISPAQNMSVVLVTLGEGFHNYHHSFPQDYRTGELGNNILNFTTGFIDFCAWLGLAYDLRSASEEVVEKRMHRTGDRTDLWGNSLEKKNG